MELGGSEASRPLDFLTVLVLLFPATQERSFCIVAYLSQLLNSVLVIVIVNARPSAKIDDFGERIERDNISWLR